MGPVSTVAIIAVVLPVLAILYKYGAVKEVIQKAAGFTSRSICSAVFLSKRYVLNIPQTSNNLTQFRVHDDFYCRKHDGFVIGNELSIIPSGIFGSSINWEDQYVEAYLFNKDLAALLQMPISTAVFLGPTLGCQLHFEQFQESHKLHRQHAVMSDAPAPMSPLKSSSSCVQDVLNADFTAEGLAQNQTRAVVVVHRGVIVAENYQSAMGITEGTPLLGWSMTKSVHAAVFGAAVEAGIVKLEDELVLADMSPLKREALTAMNGGHPLTFRHLLHMHDILEIEENYGIFADVVHMLCGSPDSAKYAASAATKIIPPPVEGENGPTFGWYYSSGVSNLFAKELRRRFATDEEYWRFPQTHLFHPIGARSFAIELDTSGTFIASSFGYATARDWARLGELFLRKGQWGGKQILSEEFVELVQQPHPRSGGHYGGQFWLNPARVSVAEYNILPHDHKEKRRREWTTQVLPADAYYMNGYLGQTTMIMPSLDTVIVRLGYTPDKLADEVPTWDPKKFYGGVLKCIRELQQD